MSGKVRKKLPTKGRGVGVLFDEIGRGPGRVFPGAMDHARMVASVAQDVLPFLVVDVGRTLDGRINADLATRRAFWVAETFVAERERRYALASARPAPPPKTTKKKGKR